MAASVTKITPKWGTETSTIALTSATVIHATVHESMPNMVEIIRVGPPWVAD